MDWAAATTAQISRIVHSPSPQSRKVPGVSVLAAAAAAVEDQAATDLGAIVCCVDKSNGEGCQGDPRSSPLRYHSIFVTKNIRRAGTHRVPALANSTWTRTLDGEHQSRREYSLATWTGECVWSTVEATEDIPLGAQSLPPRWKNINKVLKGSIVV